MILLLSGCALVTLSTTRRSHPPRDGMVQARTLDDTARIHRDEHGVPHIVATSERDAWYGLGFVHAQDRLFQADLARHMAHGRLSEFFGERTVEVDAFLRSMRLAERGRENLARQSQATREMVDAYTAGLNAGAASLKTRPVEYRLLGVPFEPWKAEDTTAIGFLQSYGLSDNLPYEIAALLLDEHPPATIDALFRFNPESPPIDEYWEELRTRDIGEFTPQFLAFTGALGGMPEASNNWVVGGERTASGKPILANDPHLRQSVPSLWYVADVKGGELHAAGATLPGSPGIVIGHNGQVAWGLTNVMADTIDLAMLQRDGTDGYILESDKRKLRTERVEITVKGAPSEVREVLWTDVGPVINDGETLVAMRWHALEVEDHLHQAQLSLAHAVSVEALRDEMLAPLSVAQNLVVADTEGAYAWQVVGAIPDRRGHTGRVPYPASSPHHGWEGWLGGLPSSANPEAGFVITANSRPEHALADQISTSYVPPHRYDRIEDVLEGLDRATAADMHTLQLDLHDGLAAKHLPVLLEGVVASGQPAACLEALQEWDFIASPSSKGAAVWGFFHAELTRATLESSGDFDATEVDLLLDVFSSGRSLLDADLHHFMRDRKAVVLTALSRSCEELNVALGDPATWQWGALHQLALDHPFGQQSNLLDKWNMPRIPQGGTGATVAASGYDWTREEWTAKTMASLRIVMPLDDLSKSTLVHPGGQSGQPGSDTYRSHWNAWVSGETVPLYWDVDDIANHVEHTLVIAP